MDGADPSDAVDSIAKQCAKESQVVIRLVPDAANDCHTLVLTVGNEKDCAEVRCEGQDASKYPEWRAAMPVAGLIQTESIGMGAEYAGVFIKAAKLLTGEPSLRIGLHGGDGAMEVLIPTAPEFYGIWMQMKAPEGETVQAPKWLHEAGAFQPELPAGAGDRDQASGVRTQESGAEEAEGAVESYEKDETIELWDDGDNYGGLMVARGKTSGKWLAHYRFTVGANEETQDFGKGKSFVHRADCVRVTCGLALKWLKKTLGKEEARGFEDKIRAVIEAHREREE